MILGVRSDAPDAHVVVINNDGVIDDFTWQAHKTLARDLLRVIKERLAIAHTDWFGITGVILFEGPGSFTGLRIGATVANTIAHEQKVPIVGSRGDDWVQAGLTRLKNIEDDKFVLPFYGADANITKPRK